MTYDEILGRRGSAAIAKTAHCQCAAAGARCHIYVRHWFFMPSGCDTRQERERISNQTKNWAATVKAASDKPEGKEALRVLARAVNGNWDFARSQACYAIRDAKLGNLAAELVPDLIKAADCGDRFVEDAAVQALGSIGPAAAQSVELLMKKTQAGVDSTSVRSVSCYAARAFRGYRGTSAACYRLAEERRQFE